MHEKEIKLPKSFTIDIKKFKEISRELRELDEDNTKTINIPVKWIEGLIEVADALAKSERGVGVDEYFGLLGYIESVKSLLPKNKI